MVRCHISFVIRADVHTAYIPEGRTINAVLVIYDGYPRVMRCSYLEEQDKDTKS